jgi:hypothetical protein
MVEWWSGGVVEGEKMKKNYKLQCPKLQTKKSKAVMVCIRVLLGCKL